jgi:hypothetical protein
MGSRVRSSSARAWSTTPQANAHDIAGWRNSLADNTQIQFWGCDVGAGDAGAAFVNDLHALTGVGVAASTDATGVASLHGDWTLERTAGAVIERVPFSADAVASYGYVLDAPIPTVTITGPTDVLLGNTFTETVSFENAASTGVGYGPFIEVYVPATTGPGASERATLTSATYLGAAVNFQTITLSDQITGHVGTVGGYNPLVLDSSGNATFIAAPAGFKNGDNLYVLTLPFGSFTPGQPKADIALNFALDNRSDLSSSGGLNIAAIGGFQYGADALNNPSTDPSIRGIDGTPGGSTAADGLVTASSNVKLIDVTAQVNTYPGEGETATGPTFPGNYTITLTPAPAVSGDPLSNLDFTLNLPNDVQYTGGTIAISGGGTATIVPNSGSPGGVLKVHFNSLSSAQTISIPIYVPQVDGTSAQVLDPGTGAPVQIDLNPNWSYAANNWTPVSAPSTAQRSRSAAAASTPASLPSPSRCRSANAYLPLPVYNVPGTLTAGNGTDVNTFAVVSNPSGGTPTATTDTTANSIGFNFGTYNDTTNTVGKQVTVKFTLRASDQPFADGLQLTTQGQTQYTNAVGSVLGNATRMRYD